MSFLPIVSPPLFPPFWYCGLAGPNSTSPLLITMLWGPARPLIIYYHPFNQSFIRSFSHPPRRPTIIKNERARGAVSKQRARGLPLYLVNINCRRRRRRRRLFASHTPPPKCIRSTNMKYYYYNTPPPSDTHKKARSSLFSPRTCFACVHVPPRDDPNMKIPQSQSHSIQAPELIRSP